MKPPSEWDEDYLLNLPDFEPMRMDFKARRGLDLTLQNVDENHVKQQLSVALSAFANTGGGLIIYGVKDPQPGKPLEIDDGGVDMTMKGRSTKEWLEDVIPNLTDFQIVGFEVHPIEGKTPNSQIAPGRAVFIVEVPDSERAPHQARDNKYYIRAGSKSVPVGHQIVMDIAGRQQHPSINLSFRMRSNLDSEREDDWQALPSGTQRRVDFIVTMHNVGRVYAQYVNCFVYIPKQLLLSQGRHERDRIVTRGNRIDYYALEVNNSTHNSTTKIQSFHIILPQLKYELSISDLLGNFSSRYGHPLGNQILTLDIEWQAFADNAPIKEGRIRVREIPVFSLNNRQIFPMS